MGEQYVPPEARDFKMASDKQEPKAEEKKSDTAPVPHWKHDESLEDLEVSEGEELDVPARYARILDTEAGSARESYEEVAETQNLEEAKRGMKLLYTEFQGQVMKNKELVAKLEHEIKEKYQILKDQQA